MQRLATVILRHASRLDVHYDWLLDPPSGGLRDTGMASGAPPLLWTGRTALAPQAWAIVRTWRIEQIGDHRRDYLTYEGPLTGGRGTVRRADHGWFTPIIWRPRRIVLRLVTRQLRGRIDCRMDPRGDWLACFEGGVRSPGAGL